MLVISFRRKAVKNANNEWGILLCDVGGDKFFENILLCFMKWLYQFQLDSLSENRYMDEMMVKNEEIFIYSITLFSSFW